MLAVVMLQRHNNALLFYCIFFSFYSMSIEYVHNYDNNKCYWCAVLIKKSKIKSVLKV